jgi:hypothetical protein
MYVDGEDEKGTENIDTLTGSVKRGRACVKNVLH